MLKTISSCHDWLDQVQFVTKTRHDKDVTDYIGVVYTEIETKLLGPIGLCAIYYKNQIGQQHARLYRCGLR